MAFLMARCWAWLRRRRLLKLPDALWEKVLADLPFLARLNAPEKARLRQLSEAFLAQKEFSGAGGLVLSDEMCVSIAVQGCLPILNLGLECYRDWRGVIVYPDEFIVPRHIEDESGVVHEFDDIASGEAWEGGPLIVSWRDVSMAGSGYNVVIHEFAHKLDMLTGEVNGIPPLPAAARPAWEAALNAAYAHFCAEEEASAPTFDRYAAENPSEFFAVMSEVFFETPERLHVAYPVLYEQFCFFYRQTPLRISVAKV